MTKEGEIRSVSQITSRTPVDINVTLTTLGEKGVYIIFNRHSIKNAEYITYSYTLIKIYTSNIKRTKVTNREFTKEEIKVSNKH